MILNLLMNAAQAIPEGRAEDHVIRIACRTDSQAHAIVEISDTGCGIAPQLVSRLFTPFFTTKPEGVGTGLGLAICQRIVTGFGGEIQVDSEVGRGTTFRVILKLASASDDTRQVPRASVIPAQRRGRVLMIDDEELLGRAVRRILCTEHDVTVHTSASEALQCIRQGDRFDVILCDLMMPNVSGMDFHAQLTREAPELAPTIIFVTGGAFTNAAHAFFAQVPNERMEKPFDTDYLRGVVNARVAELGGSAIGGMPASGSVPADFGSDEKQRRDPSGQ